MQEILEFILKNITTIPGELKIEVLEEDATTHYVISANPADIGRIIGKEGKVIKAIRTIMRVIAIQQGLHIRISVASQDESQSSQNASEPLPSPDDDIKVEV